MPRNRITRLIIFTIFLFSSTLRFSLAAVNREANDDHLEVARLIMQKKQLPGVDDCLECFQPKLFHYFMALIFQGTNIEQNDIVSQTIITQLLNAVLGTVLVLVFWVFLQSLSIGNESLKLIGFSLAAFNPSLIGINAQATNDTLAILLATLSTFFAWRFLEQERIGHLVASILFVSLGIAAKTNIFVTAFAILVALWVRAFTQRQRVSLYCAALFLPSVLFLLVINPLTQYLPNYLDYGSIVGINKPKQPFPAFFEQSYVARPGITSIQDGIFTFKLMNLLQYPRLTNGVENYPAHRTSLWTQLYAHANSVHYPNWPYSWSTKGNESFIITRTIIVLALFPATMLLIGAGISLTEFLIALLKNSSDKLHSSNYGLFDALFWGYIVFIAVYALEFRDFSFMKAIFIYPAWLSFLLMFVKSGTVMYTFLGNRWFPRLLLSTITCLIVFYILDICTLITQLYGLL